MNENQKSYFEAHPNVGELSFTEDGLCWWSKEDAVKHCTNASLPEETIETYTREDYEKSLAEAPEETPGSNGVKPIGKMNKTELLAELTARGIQADPATTNPTMVKMIQEHDAKAAE